MLSVAPSPADPSGVALRTRLTGFAGFLRANGYGGGAENATDILDAATRVGVLDREVLRWSLKALLCGRGDEWRRFDALFEAYFCPPNRRAFTRNRQAPTGSAEAAGAPGDADRRLPMAAAGGGSRRRRPRCRAPRGEPRVARLRRFRDLGRADQVRDIEALMRRFARRLKRLQLRREARSARGARVDLRGTIRRSVGSGGTPFRLAWKERRRVRPRLVLLLDVSRSMSLYSFFHLRLARALAAELADVHCFIFHTRITGVSAALADQDPWRSQERLHLLAAGWAGGTRIGECLREFNRRDGPRLVHSRTAVIIVSDGYDTGEPETLAAELAALRRRARRVVWLNPLLARADFAPVSRGMQAALPHLDLFAPGADLASIEHILPSLIETLR
jgi:uncharacterized protein with von Willebrand factor type A (vWA) domain